MTIVQKLFIFLSGFLVCGIIIACLSVTQTVESSPTKALDEREVYYPGTG